MFPTVIYAAKSTTDLRGSLTTQVADCQTAIQRATGRMVAGVFQDEAASGYSGNRGQGLARAKALAVELAEAHGEAEIWVQHSSRFARGGADSREAADHLGEIYFYMKRRGVRLRSVEDDWVLENPVMAAVAGDQNYAYSKRLSDSVAKGKERQLERGERLGGPVVDGYRLIVERDVSDRVIQRRYEIDEERAEIIRTIFEMSEAGHGDGAIATHLNRKGHRTKPREIKSGARAGTVEPGKPWSRRRVQDTLTNQTYAARVVRHRGKPNEEVAPASNVEAMVEPERYDRIIAMRAGRDSSLAHPTAVAARRRGKLGGAPALRYALSKLARCERCGSTLLCRTSPYKRKDGSQARRYVCPRAIEGGGACDLPPVDAEAVDAAIVPHLKYFFSDYAKWVESVTASTGTERETIASELAELRGQLAGLGRAEPKAQDRYSEALASDDDAKAEALGDALAKIKRDRKSLAENVSKLEARLTSLDAQSAPSDALTAYWRGIADTIAGRLSGASNMAEINAELRAVLDHVNANVGEDRKITLRAVYRHKGAHHPPMRPVKGPDGKYPASEADAEWEFNPDGQWTFEPDSVDFLGIEPRKTGQATESADAEGDLLGTGNHSQL